jgi:DNA replication and repair protein RecF
MSADPALAPEPVRPLAVTRLALTDFRCYRRLRLEAGAEPIVLTGPNGAGKTNLLEALSFLIPGRGLRRARLGEIDRRDDSLDSGPHWAVAATVLTPAGAFEIGTAHEPAAVRTINADVSDSGASESGEARDGRRIVRIDGRPSRGQASLARLVSMLWLTPGGSSIALSMDSIPIMPVALLLTTMRCESARGYSGRNRCRRIRAG